MNGLIPGKLKNESLQGPGSFMQFTCQIAQPESNQIGLVWLCYLAGKLQITAVTFIFFIFQESYNSLEMKKLLYQFPCIFTNLFSELSLCDTQKGENSWITVSSGIWKLDTFIKNIGMIYNTWTGLFQCEHLCHDPKSNLRTAGFRILPDEGYAT